MTEDIAIVVDTIDRLYRMGDPEQLVVRLVRSTIASLDPHLDTGLRCDFRQVTCEPQPGRYVFADSARMTFLLGFMSYGDSWRGRACARLQCVLYAYEAHDYREALREVMELLFYLETHGVPRALLDAVKMLGLLSGSGVQVTEETQDALDVGEGNP